MGTIRHRAETFLFSPESDRWISLLRVGLGIQVAIFSLSSRADWLELFASTGRGLVNREITEAIVNVESLYVPRFGWFIRLGNFAGISETFVLYAIWGCLFCAGCLLILGLFSRPAAATAWLLHLCTIKSEEFLTYGMDNFTTIGLFYLMFCPLPDRCALDYRRLGQARFNAQLSGFFRRVLQVHVCIIYFFGGATKCLGPEWWTGDSIWRALTSPPYNLVSPQFLIAWKFMLPVAGIAVCIIETGFPLFIWFRQTRLVWLILVCGMHLMIALTMGLQLFSLIMIILCLAAFGPEFSFDSEKLLSVLRRPWSWKRQLSPSDTVRVK